MALPSTNITTTLVGQELGVSTHNVGALCTSNKINKWSKYKPVNYNKNIMTDTDYKLSNWGFIINSNQSNNFSDIWSFNPPVGGSTSPFRLGDFRQYSTDEDVPMYINNSYLTQTWNVLESNTPTFNCIPTYKVGGNSYFGTVNSRLNVDDFFINNNGSYNFKDLYFSVAAYNNNLGRYEIVTAPNSLIDVGSGKVNGIQNLSSTTYLSNLLNNMAADTSMTIYPFLNTTNVTSHGEYTRYETGYIVPLPKYQPITFRKINEWWLKLDPLDITITNGVWGIYMTQQSTTSSAYTNLTSSKTAVSDSNSNDVISVTLSAKIYKNQNGTKTIIDLKNITASSAPRSTETYTIIDSMTIVNKMYFATSSSTPSITSVNQTITYNSDPLVNTSYDFSEATAPNIYPMTCYIVRFTQKNIPVTEIKNNATTDSNLPSIARYTANMWFKINDNTANTSMWVSEQKMPYRFSYV